MNSKIYRYVKAFGIALKKQIPYLRDKKTIHALITTTFMVVVILLSIPNDSMPATATQKTEVSLADEIIEEDIAEQAIWGSSEIDQVIGNNGFPYGKNTEDGVSLSIQLADGITSATYQWQYSTDKLNWQNLDGATSQTYSTKWPKDANWYRCLVNDSESRAIQLIGKFECKGESETDSQDRIWTNPFMPWYFSNGSIAYSVSTDLTSFDVVGLYNKGETAYMIQTSYSGGWSMVTSSSDGPALNHSAAVLDDLIIGFDKYDDYNLYIDADLAAGQRAFAFGCDTMVGNGATSKGHADFAALELNKKDDNTIANIAMIGAGSTSQASDNNPGFVITPMTDGDIQFWLGQYNDRKYFEFNEGTGNVTVDDQYYEGICTEALGVDAGMTLSWFNVEEGSIVRFKFAVGDADSIGVTTGSATINYVGELIEGLKENSYYRINVVDQVNSYIFRTNALGHLAFRAVDDQGKSYDLTGKRLHIVRIGDDDIGMELKINPRPTNIQELPDSDDVVSITDSTVTITIPLGNLQLFAQEYRIYDEEGNELEGFGWTRPLGDGTLTFTGLDSDTIYTIKARVFATESAPNSLPSKGYRFRTK